MRISYIRIVFGTVLWFTLACPVLGATLSASSSAIDEGSEATIHWTLNGYSYPYEQKFGYGRLTYSAGGSTTFDKNYTSSYASGTLTEDFADDGVFTRSLSGYVYYKSYYVPNGLLSHSGTTYPSDDFSITVRNVAPTIVTIAADTTVAPDDTFAYFATATDPGVNDILTFNWDLDGDGAYDDGTGASGGLWSFATAGSYTVGLEVSDGDGGVATGSFTVGVIPEPATLSLLALGGLAILRNRRKQ